MAKLARGRTRRQDGVALLENQPSLFSERTQFSRFVTQFVTQRLPALFFLASHFSRTLFRLFKSEGRFR
jgi:hypothetical protein